MNIKSLWSTALNVSSPNLTSNDSQLMYLTGVNHLIVLIGNQVFVIDSRSGELKQRIDVFTKAHQLAGSSEDHFWVVDSHYLYRVFYVNSTQRYHFNITFTEPSGSPIEFISLDSSQRVHILTADTMHILINNASFSVSGAYSMVIPIGIGKESEVLLLSRDRRRWKVGYNRQSNVPTFSPVLPMKSPSSGLWDNSYVFYIMGIVLGCCIGCWRCCFPSRFTSAKKGDVELSVMEDQESVNSPLKGQ
eukprot:TRINITY_DN7398_c0_g1_i1.p1 TRINITY_DN7398_c0_g1~~TRINITY_DN7398_c0_g1_i1.p1  ORF type:complete len:247 (-),score=38.10 TRINITY_DN7398_c0_g1_i1:251-991(-)